ncbi:piercer of microtubule wall 2 protein-like [Sycon ciliatum]|uniref:piercer of microtubule wall 2 protein-like n=1 Tax=Sycon ciliatum TaxID=27933 RepID=UPI0020A9608C|eukprot:scpid98654/ scgid23404/ UPF0691 protein C9orf116 homolog
MDGQENKVYDTKHPTGISTSVPIVGSANPGNPVASVGEIEIPEASEWYQKGTAAASQHPMYRTTTATAYGARHNTVEFLPTSHHGKNNGFSQHLAGAGMYRDKGLNTTTDKKFLCQPST